MKYYTEQLSDKGTVAVDDTILVKGVQAAAGSRIMEGFKPLFSADAVDRLVNKGYVISGKTHVGEFGLDLVGEFSYYADKEEALKGAAGFLRRELGSRLTLRKVPELRFIPDNSIEHSAHIARMLEGMKTDNEENKD